MAIQINGTSGISGVDGSAATPALQGTDTNSGISFPAADTVAINTGGSERSRVDSSGRLLVGTSTASGILTQVLQGNSAGSTSYAAFLLARGEATIADGNYMGEIGFSDNTYTISSAIRAHRDGGTWSSTSKPSRLVFSTTADGAASPTEAMRIDNAGRVAFNYGSTNGVLTDWGYGGYRGIVANSNVTTLSSQRASWFLRGSLQSSNSELANCILLLQDTGGAAVSPGDLIKGYSGSTFVFRVANNGAVQNSANSYGALSDQRLKQNIEDAGSQWDDIKQVQVRKFRFCNEPEVGPYIGVIAQEVEAISPGLVDQALLENGNPDPEGFKSVKYSVLYMKAVKALQEAMERIETLEASNADLLARVSALESA